MRKGIYVTLGSDFLQAPMLGHSFVVLPMTVRFKDLRGVGLDISKGRITGAVAAAKYPPVSMRWVKEPATIVRTVFEGTGPEVTWRRVGRFRHVQLSRDQVRKLIEDSAGKDINGLLPPGASYVTADEFSSGTATEVVAHTFDPPAPAERYVNLMLLKMSRNGLSSRTIKRSETLPSIRLKDETVEPPPVDEVTNRLKFMCALKPRAYRKPIDGSFDIQVQRVHYKVTCHFNDGSDPCCTIHMEIAQTAKDN